MNTKFNVLYLGFPGIEQQGATGFHIDNISGHDRHLINNTL